MNEHPIITAEDVRRGQELLRRYRAGKAALEQRLVEDELWWRLRHRELIDRNDRLRPFGAPPFAQSGQASAEAPAPGFPRSEPASAWLFNAVVSKHADAMDNYPEPVVLPREASDAPAAALLTQILPALLENADFEQVWSDAWWEKLKHGTAAYGVFWNAEKDGLGDAEVRVVDLLRLYWEPGVEDIQRSRSLFLTELADNDSLIERWPQLKGKLGAGPDFDPAAPAREERADTSDKSLVVDWYYKKRGADGRTRLHYIKFVGDELLYASENDPACAEDGFYAHGLYPVVLDVLFPVKGSPAGFGYVAVCKDPQTYVDRLFGSILDYAQRAVSPRFFMATSTGVNEKEFLDWSKPVVHVEGTLDDTRIRPLALEPLSGVYTGVLRMKIDEMKDTASNRDVSNGGAEKGVTAASAIAALQEAGSKTARDMIAAGYRANTKIAALLIELIRQFYDERRFFRVVGPGGETAFASIGGETLRPRAVGADSLGGTLWRRPVFDLKVRVRRKNPFSVLEQNERAARLYSMGFFDPARADEALAALEIMEFEGVEALRERVKENAARWREGPVGEGLAPPAVPLRAPGSAPAPGDALPPGANVGEGLAPPANPAPAPASEAWLRALARRSAPQGAVE